MLTVGAKTDALAQLIHSVNVIHPVGINASEQHYALDFTHNIAAEFFFALLIARMCLFLEVFGDFFSCCVAEFLRCKVQIIRRSYPTEEIFAHTV